MVKNGCQQQDVFPFCFFVNSVTNQKLLSILPTQLSSDAISVGGHRFRSLEAETRVRAAHILVLWKSKAATSVLGLLSGKEVFILNWFHFDFFETFLHSSSVPDFQVEHVQLDRMCAQTDTGKCLHLKLEFALESSVLNRCSPPTCFY